LYKFTTTAGATTQSVVFNTTGQYVDISSDLNLKLYDTEKKLITVEEYDKLYGYKDSNTDRRISVTLAAAPKVIAQDKDYIYLLTNVNITGAVDIHSASLASLNHLTLVQKVSKAQGEKAGKAYVPKTTASYIYDAADQFDIDDAKDAGAALARVYTNNAQVRAIDGVLYVSYLDGGKVHVYEVKLNTHGRSEALSELANNQKHVKYDLYTATKGEDTDKDATSYAIDTDGAVWIVDDGEIKKSVKAKDFETLYEVDSKIDKLDVYNEGNLIAWSSDSDRYTTITEGKKQTTDDALVVDPNVNADKFKTGFDATTKKYYKDGALVTNAWVSDAGKWYFVDENSTAKTGWYKNAQGTYYYLQADGAMLTGWFKDPADGNWYYLDPVNTSGAMKTGWFQDTTGTWYFTDGSGKMLSNQYVGGYWLNGSGAWV
jgi:glucan-binding YG repeat protein